MTAKVLIIYEYKILFEILNEIRENLNFKILNSNKDNYKKINKFKVDEFLVVCSENHPEIENSLVLKNLPIKLNKLLEIINVSFLKKKYVSQSQLKIGRYILDMNSREISFENKKLSLTEREAEVILFLNSENNVTIQKLQNNVWSYSADLETHTVETHIYRLRKKMKESFDDENFIINEKKDIQSLEKKSNC